MSAEQHPVVARWRAHLDSLTEFVLRAEVEKFVAGERESHPDELADWLDAIAVQTLVARARTYELSADRQAAARRFRAFATGEADEDEDVRDPFMATYVIAADDTRKRLGEMVAEDHRFVAASYRAEGNRALMLASFHSMVAKKLGKRTTAEVFTVETYGRLLLSVEPQAA